MNPANSEFAPLLIQQLAIHRYGQPKEIAGLVAFLARDENRFITGAALTIDGEYNI